MEASHGIPEQPVSEHLRRLSWPAWLCTAEGPAIYPQRIGGSAVVTLVEVRLDIVVWIR